MPYLPVHEEALDRATGRMRVVKKRPTQHFLEWTPGGMALYMWQGGAWYGHGERPLPAEQVPEDLRARVKAQPPTIAAEGPEVVETCEFCGVAMNTAELKEHYIEHVRAQMDKLGKPGKG